MLFCCFIVSRDDTDFLDGICIDELEGGKSCYVIFWKETVRTLPF